MDVCLLQKCMGCPQILQDLSRICCFMSLKLCSSACIVPYACFNPHPFLLHAGLTGLLLAASCLREHQHPPIKHLQNVNLYVEAALTDWQRSSSMTASLPRQAAASSSSQQNMHHAGTSSFGMSGVNAHALVSVSTDVSPAVSETLQVRLDLRSSSDWMSVTSSTGCALALYHAMQHTFLDRFFPPAFHDTLQHAFNIMNIDNAVHADACVAAQPLLVCANGASPCAQEPATGPDRNNAFFMCVCKGDTSLPLGPQGRQHI